jgi:4,5-DOPA dioxygenase extradiol
MPEFCAEVADAVAPKWVGCDVDSWGIDHGTWSVLTHMFPDADIPVVQLAINAMKPFDYHLDLGAKLAPLRDSGVMVIGSGNIVHNLRAVDFGLPDDGYDWALRFDEAARGVLVDSPTEIAALDGHRDFRLAVPTPDHYLPMLYIAGLAGETPLDPLVDGYAAGSISMAAYTLGLNCPSAASAGTGGSAELPEGFPALDSNL